MMWSLYLHTSLYNHKLTIPFYEIYVVQSLLSPILFFSLVERIIHDNIHSSFPRVSSWCKRKDYTDCGEAKAKSYRALTKNCMLRDNLSSESSIYAEYLILYKCILNHSIHVERCVGGRNDSNRVPHHLYIQILVWRGVRWLSGHNPCVAAVVQLPPTPSPPLSVSKSPTSIA